MTMNLTKYIDLDVSSGYVEIHEALKGEPHLDPGCVTATTPEQCTLE